MFFCCCCFQLQFCQENFCNLPVKWTILLVSDFRERFSSITDEFKLFGGGDKDDGDGGEEGDRGDEDEKEDDDDEEDDGDDDDDDDEDGIKGEMDAAFLDRELLKTIMAQKDPDLLRALGHQFEDFVLYCTYLGVNCAWVK